MWQFSLVHSLSAIIRSEIECLINSERYQMSSVSLLFIQLRNYLPEREWSERSVVQSVVIHVPSSWLHMKLTVVVFHQKVHVWQRRLGDENYPAAAIKRRGSLFKCYLETILYTLFWKFINKLSVSIQDNTPGNEIPTPMQLLEVVTLRVNPKPNEMTSILRYSASLPEFILPYILDVGEVRVDGNYGFRVITSSLDLGEDQWGQIQRDLIIELKSNKPLCVTI